VIRDSQDNCGPSDRGLLEMRSHWLALPSPTPSSVMLEHKSLEFAT
jgi:hypothetical protein